ncbi:phosphoserine phosphatase SerB [Neisseria brasiliensis]|uniref:phosphoserine phosphatase SerB n=1 Tax=Neisseria TaxID=482 RepID=UPI000C275099|nr:MULTISPECIES: phosphoserine phosphatase SerB [Neisseria]PJO78877.1 phosphoserine phosphatase SerB [Neisseria sp. N177_16]QGL25634.1 phosphoserine phosphatase SerB [Neisseria brasiliensis]
MSNVLVLQHSDLSRCDLSALQNLNLAAPQHMPHSLRFTVAEDFTLPAAAKSELDRQEIDAAVLPDMAFNDLGLIVSDMDSTLITIECIDEIAAGAGLKAQVAEITERAMRGELDFEQSLRSRVALLKGLDEQFLHDVYENVLQLSPGAEYLLAECKKHDVKFLLVSGGFTFFTERLQQRFGFEYQFANVLEIIDGKLTGQVLGDVVDAQRKQNLLKEYRDKLGLTAAQTLAMGDGANDIPMLEAAGIGVAYRAKPKAQAHADACINFGGLERIRDWLR